MRLGLLVLLIALAAGCGGSSTSTLGSVTRADLAIMVLPADELGEIASGLDVDPESGYQDAAEVAADTLDPSDTAEDIEATGLRANYQLNYSNAGDSNDPVQVTSQVALFGSAEEATDFVATTVGDAERQEGVRGPTGATITNVDIAEADEPGDSAWQGSATATVGTTEISSTVVAFTIDQVAANVSVTQLGDPVPTEDVQELAQKLAVRIEAVAANELSDTPVSVPTETTPTAQQDPALQRMVLALTDLPFGVSVKDEGYVTGGDDASFQRDFALGNAKIGKSELIGLQSNAERMDSAAEAAVAVKAVSGVVQGPAGRKLFAESFAQGAGFSAESLRINELPGEGIGDEATVLHATFDTRAGPFEAILVFVAEGRAAGQIYAAGAKGKIFAEDILGLARTMARKMKAEEK
jgi:hypothetical protein